MLLGEQLRYKDLINSLIFKALASVICLIFFLVVENLHIHYYKFNNQHGAKRRGDNKNNELSLFLLFSILKVVKYIIRFN